MAAKLSLLSLTQLQQLAQSEPMSNHQHQPGYGHGQWAWRSKVRAPEESDDSWEVRAFAEDYTGTVSGSTWPPRSYTCTFCKREFRSAQALGGHMNVHRRDRATKQLHHYLPSPAAGTATSSCTLVTPDRELQNFNGGFCLLYQLPPQSNAAMPGSQFPMPATHNFAAKHGSSNGSSHVYSTKTEVSSARSSNCLDVGNVHGNWNRDSGVEDLDLELRLGNRPFQS